MFKKIFENAITIEVQNRIEQIEHEMCNFADTNMTFISDDSEMWLDFDGVITGKVFGEITYNVYRFMGCIDKMYATVNVTSVTKL